MGVCPIKKNLLGFNVNRVRRNYKGGMLLDALQGVDQPRDAGSPEEWIASTVRAKNPGLSKIPQEGLSSLSDGGSMVCLKELFTKAPEHYLGLRHIEKYGVETGFLVKFLDSAMRLHIQAHPSAEFARKHLNSRWGKLEVYIVLEVRKNVEPYIFLGFQNPPSPEEWKRIIVEQDLEAMQACFEKIQVQAGEVWYVPGGLPHAIGEGILMVEIMEPTDLVVRCEFEREGIVVPENARFMGQTADEALKIFDYRQFSAMEIRSRFSVKPELIESSPDLRLEKLIGKDQTECFEIYRYKIRNQARFGLSGKAVVWICISGSGRLFSGADMVPVRKGTGCMSAAAAREIIAQADGDETLELIACLPQL